MAENKTEETIVEAEETTTEEQEEMTEKTEETKDQNTEETQEEEQDKTEEPVEEESSEELKKESEEEADQKTKSDKVATRVSTHKRRKHKKKRYLLRLLILAIACGIAVGIMHLPHFDVQKIVVNGNQEITDEEVIKLSGIKTGQSIFDVHPLWVNHKIKSKNLYVEKVNVDRKFPKKVTLTIVEKRAMAQIQKGNRYVVMDIDGTVIEVAKEEKRATLIENVHVKNATRKEPVEVKEAVVLEKALDLIVTADENDMYFKKIVIDGKNVEAYIFDSLVCKGKYKNIVSCLESGTLKSVVYDLYQKDKETGTITVSSNNYCFFTPKK